MGSGKQVSCRAWQPAKRASALKRQNGAEQEVLDAREAIAIELVLSDAKPERFRRGLTETPATHYCVTTDLGADIRANAATNDGARLSAADGKRTDRAIPGPRASAASARRAHARKPFRHGFTPIDEPEPKDSPSMTAQPRIAYVNGEFLPLSEAKISIMDRGFLFADGIYEVSAVLDGKLIDNDAHLNRLDRSLGELGIANPHDLSDWIAIEEALIAKNALDEGVVYIEVTRGVAERDFLYAPALKPTVVAFTQTKNILANPLAARGARIVTLPDLRWARRDIKTIALLAQVLAKQAAAKAGANEAWLIEDGFVTEGGSSTPFLITADKRIVTRPLSNALLPGITRRSVMQLASAAGLVVEERAFSVDEAKAAAEAFFTSASSFVVPIVAIDDACIGDGQPGSLTRELQRIYMGFARNGPMGTRL